MKKLDNEKPNWARMVRIKKPTGGVYPGCWEEGRMVGYAEAITDLKKDLAARLTICDNNYRQRPEGMADANNDSGGGERRTRNDYK